MRLKAALPQRGHAEWPCEQAQHRFVMDVEVQATANPQFNKVILRVREADASLLQMVMIQKANL
jgi:hypothetical protein